MILNGAILFGIIYFAVRLAIKPLIEKDKNDKVINEDVDLISLRDLEVLSDEELNDIYKLYSEQQLNNTSNQQLKRYIEVLEELKNIEYLSEEEFLLKVQKLKVALK